MHSLDPELNSTTAMYTDMCCKLRVADVTSELEDQRDRYLPVNFLTTKRLRVGSRESVLQISIYRHPRGLSPASGESGRLLS